jgi:hypothetical protein
MGLFDGFNQALPAVVLRTAAPLVSAVLPIFLLPQEHERQTTACTPNFLAMKTK